MAKHKQAQAWDHLDWWRNRLDIGKDDGNRVKAICPGHDDDKPSLGVTQIRPGKVVWKCYAGCEQQVVLDAAQGIHSDQSDPEPKVQDKPRKLRTRSKVSIASDPLSWLAEYTATDTDHLTALGVDVAGDKLIYRVEGWTNAKYRKADSKEIGWTIKGGGRPPLWPTVPDVVGKEVWITEGETDAIVLQAWGIEAYAMLGGADNPPEASVFRELGARGAEVIVSALDADEAGRKGTGKLLGIIAEAGLRSRVAKPRSYSPISGFGKDWRDARRRGDYKPTVTAPRHGLDYMQLATRANKGMDWYLNGILGRGVVTLLAGLPKAGKSTLVFNILAALEDDDRLEFMGRGLAKDRHDERQGIKTIYLSEESPYTIYQKMAGRLRETVSVELQIDAAREQEDFLETLSRVCETARTEHVDLIVIDTVSAWTLMEDENKASEVTETIQRIRVMTQGLGVVLVHHANKVGGENGVGIRGSGAWAATVDVILELGFPSESEELDPTSRLLNILSRYEDRTAPIMIDREGKLVEADGGITQERLITLIASGFDTQTKLVMETKISQPTISRWLRKMVDDEVLIKTKTTYRLA